MSSRIETPHYHVAVYLYTNTLAQSMEGLAAHSQDLICWFSHRAVNWCFDCDPSTRNECSFPAKDNLGQKKGDQKAVGLVSPLV
jgi:hypothetical protein